MNLTDRIHRIQPSITLELAARARERAAAGHDVVDMAVGEPDFPAPAAVRRAAAAKAEGGDVRYTAAAGTPALRAALVAHLSETRGTAFSPEEVTVCHSCKHALSGALWSVAQDGDEVLVPLPAWASYFELVRVTGAEPVLVPPLADSVGARPDLAALADAVTPRTRAILVNSPSNPSGYVWTPEETAELGELAVEHDVWILSDEIYRALVYDGTAVTSPASLGPEVRARTAVLDGASKCFAMTGYRIGFIAAPRELAGAVAKLHSQTAGSPNAIAQDAYTAALRSAPPEVEEMRRAFAERRAILVEGLGELGLPTPAPLGAFYAFPDVSMYLDERGSAGFCEDLLEEEDVALVPGSAFGVEENVRLSYATDVGRIRECLSRLGAFLGRRADRR